MEIVLKDTKGVSPETIISIRAGATRRQVPVSLVGEKPFKFPCAVRDCGAIKVDLLTVAASARAVLTPESDQTITLPIGQTTLPKQVDQPADDAEVTLLVREAGEGPPKEDAAAKKKAVAGSAEEYMEKHRVHSMLQGLLSGLIKDRPDDPYSYVAGQFKSKAMEKAPVEDLRTQARDALLQGARSGRLLEVLRDGGSPKSRHDQTPTNGQKEAGVQEESGVDHLRKEAAALLLKGAQTGKLFEVLQSRKTGEDLGEPEQAPPEKPGAEGDPPVAPEEMDVLKQKAREALLAGAQSGKLQAALAERPGQASQGSQAQDVSVEKLRLQAREVLLKGAQSGKLHEVMAARQGEEFDVDQVRGEAYSALLEAAESGQLEKILSGKDASEASSQAHPDLLRKLARATLMEGAETGRLEEALSKRRANAGQPAATTLKEQARAALMKGAESGKLQEILERKKQVAKTSAQVDNALALRAWARSALMDGAESGKLQEILASRKKASATENDEVDALRQQAREALLEGAQSGKLLEMLYAKKNNADEVESLRTQARDALMDGMASGKLEEILSKKHEDEDVNQLRQQALQALLSGASSGKLSEILAQKAAGAGTAESEAEEVEALRQQARAALLEGAGSGKLQEVLAQKKQEVDNVEDLRLKARDALLAGAQSGKLQGLLMGSGNEVTQTPEELKESLQPDRAKIMEMQAELKIMAEHNKKLASEKECLEQLVAELEAKNAELKSKST